MDIYESSTTRTNATRIVFGTDRACIALGVASLILLLGSACGDDDESSEEGSHDAGQVMDAADTPTPPTKEPIAEPCVPVEPPAKPSELCAPAGTAGSALPVCEQWAKIEPKDAVCSDGSQFKFFVNLAATSRNLLVMFEPGGACWDFESCSGGLRGAANPQGITDDHMSKTNYQYLNLLRRSDDNPARDWNLIFVPYCTGDVHVGDKVATYADPAGGPALTYRHAGLNNSLSVVDWLKSQFSDVPRLLVTGCSAGGIAALQMYPFIREALAGTQCGYLLDDAGPAFHSDGPSAPLHAKIREAWNLESFVTALRATLGPSAEADGLDDDTGALNTAVADRYPRDRLSLSAFRMDFNFSLYSYERFFPGSTPADIHAKYWTDMRALMRTFDSRSNLAYYIPYFRSDNCSHCVSIPPIGQEASIALTQPWLGSDIAADGLNLKDFVNTLLDDTQPLESYVEEPRLSADFTPEQLEMCLTPN